MIRDIIKFIKNDIYHRALAIAGVLYYRRPARHIKIVGITGTKGKTTTAEIVNSILEKAGYKTALAGTLRFKIGARAKKNLLKMTMPGRFFLQKFIREAVDEGCDWIILEMTSGGAEQWRHYGIDLDAFIFLNLAPEHIELHGGIERYRDMKHRLATCLESGHKGKTVLVLNRDTEESKRYLDIQATERVTYSLADAKPYKLSDTGMTFTLGDIGVKTKLVGEFNLSNIMAAAAFASAFGVELETIKLTLETFRGIRGRVEGVDEGQRFKLVVDYAHTPDSLLALYKTYEDKKIVAVLGNAGGGRDTWKRPEMAKIADQYAEYIFLSNEDPYDEDPRAIVDEMAEAIESTPMSIVMDRRKAIRKALETAEKLTNKNENVAVLLSGKGTDPYIMGPKGTKIPWNEAKIARDELRKLINRGAIKGTTIDELSNQANKNF